MLGKHFASHSIEICGGDTRGCCISHSGMHCCNTHASDLHLVEVGCRLLGDHPGAAHDQLPLGGEGHSDPSKDVVDVADAVDPDHGICVMVHQRGCFGVVHLEAATNRLLIVVGTAFVS